VRGTMKRGGERSEKVFSELEPYYIGSARCGCRMQRQYFSHEFSGATGLQPAWLCKENSNNEDVGGDALFSSGSWCSKVLKTWRVRLKIAVSVVRFRPWAPLAFPAQFFFVRARSPISKNPRKIRRLLLN